MSSFTIPCQECGQAAVGPITGQVEDSVFVRAYVICPDCLSWIPKEIANDFFDRAKTRRLALRVEEEVNRERRNEKNSI